MSFSFPGGEVMTNEIDDLLRSSDRFIGDSEPLTRLRAALRDPSSYGFSPKLWRDAAALGLTALMAPERVGGFELGAAAGGAVMELCGRHLAPEPFVSTVALAGPMLARARSAKGDSILSQIVTGHAVVAVAAPSARELTSGAFPVVAARQSGGWRVRGELPMVPDGPQADWVLFPAVAERDPAWFVVAAGALKQTHGALMDGRRFSRIRLDQDLDETALLATGAEGHALTETLTTTGAALLSAWLLGVAERAFALTLEHLRTRRQFGATLGSFQALQHRMAILHCELAVARAVSEAALKAIDAGAPDATLLASAAKVRSASTADLAAAEGIQMHGALGMTEEADIGFYYKGARLGDLLAGHSFFHKQRAAQLLGL